MNELILLKRGKGKTTRLLKECAKNSEKNIYTYFVCADTNEAIRVAEEAQKLKLIINFPLTYDEFLKRNVMSGITVNYYIDDVDMLLSHLAGRMRIT
ncbi:MAG: hypothetical protein PHX51_08575 [Clostridia bacterium]|nr:hypothetical protein [Clostridia bacterium]